MYTVDQVADWFIARGRAEMIVDDYAEPITKMKLQKLLYFAQGVNLAAHNQRLFDSNLYAFDHGPVTSEIQDKYDGKDLPEFQPEISDDRKVELADNFDRLSSDKNSAEVLDFVWNQYSKYTASKLRDLSHDPDGPWAAIYRPRVMWNKIDDLAVEKYFKDRVVDVD